MKAFAEILLSLLVLFIPAYTNNEDSSVYLTGSLAVFLLLYYTVFRRNFTWKTDHPILIVFLGFILTDCVNIYASVTNSEIALQYFLPLIYQFGVIYAFRLEGTRVVFNKLYDFLKIGIPSLIFFLLFGFYALDHPNHYEYMSMFVGSLLIALLIVLSFFRPTCWFNYVIGFVGSSALGITGILYFLLDINAVPPTCFPVMNGFYLLAEFLLVKAILDNLNEKCTS